jgi:asparagine synthase (glutamine-hydrolysing)
MCGLVGFLSANQSADFQTSRTQLKRMSDSISHRGPDSFGYWHDASGIALAHRRLAIVDLTHTGSQPMHSHCGRYVIAFNGEIYNHQFIRNELSKTLNNHVWSGNSDTETLITAFSIWGIRPTVERCIGMFAFAVWDRVERELTLGRDRMGEKPLYYGWQGSENKAFFLFGSELKAIKQHDSFSAEIDRDALCLLMRHSYIPAPYSIYQGIRKLEAGCLLTVSATSRVPVITRYWSTEKIIQKGIGKSFTGTADQAIDQLDILLKSAVKQQMMADVPLGAFLSGGVDSSTVVALMQVQSDRPIKTFTIGFHEDGYNEAVHAGAVAKHLGTDHTELYVTPQSALDVIPRLPHLFCEPFGDSSQIPTFLVSTLARQQVSVSLSGDAGDELFGGYNRYIYTDRLWKGISLFPIASRRLAAAGLLGLSPARWDSVVRPVQGFLPSSLRTANVGDKLHKAAGVLSATDVTDLYRNLVSHWRDPADLVIGGREPPTLLTGNSPNLIGLNDIQRMMALDTLSYLTDDILVKVDRASMGVSLEGRMPFLDHRVVDFAWKLPHEMKLRDGVGKWALREVLYRYVPKALIERPKVGFAVPIADWLRGPLRDWAEALLDESRLNREGFFHSGPVRQKWSEHLQGIRNWQNHLWNVLMFQAWLEQQTTGYKS